MGISIPAKGKIKFLAGIFRPEAVPISRALQDIFYDPQTSGGLLISIPEDKAQECLKRLCHQIPQAQIVGYVTEFHEKSIVLE